MDEIKILVADDDEDIRDVIEILLNSEGYQVYKAKDGQEALEMMKENTFRLVILDIMMPGLNGYQACVEIRKYSMAPILFLSAKSQDSDKTLCFSSGGDDYMSKPFSYNELVSRVKALLRRYMVYKGDENTSEPAEALKVDGVVIDEQKRIVTVDDAEIDLTDIEFQLLVLLVKNRGQVFSAERLYETIWKESYYYSANNTVMVHMRNLRKKIEKDPQNPQIIKTIWGKGYRCD
ncbi:response regulator [Clostridiaceae bacterium DONG20-135]|uniref:Response regulator n=1 Tax=Copranaerobaculum intestinale TaxID=2692629 RepID=A0A6N8UA79_9FIRM|nr:response regulator transcription factor [Copranaerobaculum intestinale]MXQ72717.1 response regulator [Copranaerobaculum intestinale]